jgi:hypothetical protein
MRAGDLTPLDEGGTCGDTTSLDRGGHRGYVARGGDERVLSLGAAGNPPPPAPTIPNSTTRAVVIFWEPPLAASVRGRAILVASERTLRIIHYYD